MIGLAGLLASLALGLIVAGCSAGEDEPEGAFYMEARVVTVTDVVPAGSAQPFEQPDVTEFRWWHRDETHFRHEVVLDDPMLVFDPLWSGANGEGGTVLYDPRVGGYERVPNISAPLGRGSNYYPFASARLGPLPAESVDEFIEQQLEQHERVERGATEEILGRRVEVIEFESSGPTSIHRYYIDTESGFVLRASSESEGPGGFSYDAEVTALDLTPNFEDDRFETALPEDAWEIIGHEDGCFMADVPSGEPGRMGPDELIPFYEHVPPGWSHDGGGGSGTSSCHITWSSDRMSRAGGEWIVVVQRPVPATGMPQVNPSASSFDLDGTEAYRLSDSGIEYLLWVQDNVIVTIESNAAAFEELLRVAESAK